ncbi:metallophosphoesterase [Stratiformator vulcanicus]|uniref:Diadenosine tetraphosphatase n=1 Tax=Stratiformator vulcanicus TaxID=2527980 RepID=A0A517R5N0_9PLAN|nr:metallophosphoesterase [Stratiformator vulcanicus]QDT39160.1 diadenosine tetraphosphatase [Stratiformator vulcanicus]
MPGRTIAIGDVHGFDQPLETLIDRLDLGADDFVVQLGDICDRGPNTRRCIDLLRELSEHCRVAIVLGNHDEMMLTACGRIDGHGGDYWHEVGGAETISSYGSSTKDVSPAHLDYLMQARPYVETDSHLFVHANWEFDIPGASQPAVMLRWQKIDGAEPALPDGRRIVCGHTAQKSKRPLMWPGWVCIDTRVYAEDGRLTALDVDSDLVYQVGTKGRVFDPVPLDEIALEP